MGQIATAQLLKDTGKFSFNTSNSSNVKYVTDMSQCLTATTIKACINSGYTVTISGSPGTNQMISMDQITTAQQLGTLTLNHSSAQSAYPQQASTAELKQFTSVSSITSFSTFASNGVNLLSGYISSNSGGTSSSDQIKLNTGYGYVAMPYISSSGVGVLIYASITAAQISTINSGGSVTLSCSYKTISIE